MAQIISGFRLRAMAPQPLGRFSAICCSENKIWTNFPAIISSLFQFVSFQNQDLGKICNELYFTLIVCFFLSQTFSKDQYFLNLLNFGRLHVSACCPDHICQWTDQWSQIYLKTNNRLNTFTFTPSQTSKGFKNNHPSGVVSLLLLAPQSSALTPPHLAPSCTISHYFALFCSDVLLYS